MKDEKLQYALDSQRTEITEHFIYLRLAKRAKKKKNAEILRKIAEQEKMHADYWRSKTGRTIKPRKFMLYKTVFLARFLGLTFMLKQMEKREGTGSRRYSDLGEVFPEAKNFAEEERVHEKEILSMLDEERLRYVGSIVLGLNDALVELTGALAGFTLALGETRVISLAGLVTGISAAFSMAASEYLSAKADGNPRAKRSAMYTGLSYFITVILLILPFLLLSNKFIALGIVLAVAVLIIFLFNYYIATAKDLNFKKRFLEMAAISLGVAAFSFLVGYVLRTLLGVDI
ncbi:MAG: VIT1/CCC1 transporter family protein [Candidatus Marinimicrobia bacterium]|nr:VIT1/CCC1 transporter family protein [Candidatus Neomarinimicrobiota bacterium]